jgi:hypothetical protein
MKTLVIILGAVVLILCGVLFLNNHKADQQYHAAVTNITALSNQVTELSTRMVLEGVKAAAAQGGAESNLTHCVRQFVAASNSLALVTRQLAAAETARQAAQAERATCHAQLETLQAQLAAAQANVQALNAEVLQLAESRKALVAAQQKASALTEALGLLRVQYAELSGQIEDPEFLRLQSEKAKDLAKLRKRQAAAKPNAPADPHAPLLLLPDGSVRLASQTNGALP